MRRNHHRAEKTEGDGEEKYEKIIDEFQTKILNKFEKFVDGEHQGHNCSGKCTKIEDKDFKVEKYNFVLDRRNEEKELLKLVPNFESEWVPLKYKEVLVEFINSKHKIVG